MKKNSKKIAIYNPYMDILGGGERHILSIAQVYDKQGYDVDVLWDDPSIKEKIEKRLEITFHNLSIVPNFLRHSTTAKLKKTKEYDTFIYVTDGSYFFSFAKHNYIFVMVPSRALFPSSISNSLKLMNAQIISNSPFTTEKIREWFHKKVITLPPYIEDSYVESTIGKKEKIILNVGRFFSHQHSKKQEIAIQAFQELEKNKLADGYTLVLAGGLIDNEKPYFDSLKKLANGNKHIVFAPNISHQQLNEYYEKANIYWHCTGYGIDEHDSPEKMEHFGITPLEAMANGCITMCVNSGGPKLFISDGENGFVYETIEELVNKTLLVIQNNDIVNRIQTAGKQFVKENFSYEAFEKNVKGELSL